MFKTIMPCFLCVCLLWLSTVAHVGTEIDTSGLKYVVPGAKCQTTTVVMAATTLSDLERAYSIIGSGDQKATRQMYAQGVVIDIPQMMIFVEERRGNYAQIRPEGRLDRLWITALRLECRLPKRGEQKR